MTFALLMLSTDLSDWLNKFFKFYAILPQPFIYLYTRLSLGNVNTSILSDSSQCSGRPDGNYALVINNVTFKNNFLSCVHGIAYCRPCPDPAGPLLYYSEVCDQCLLPADASKCLFMSI